MKLEHLVRDGISDVKTYVPGEYKRGYVKLCSNENNWGPSPHVIETLRNWVDKSMLYPYRNDEIRDKIAGFIGCGMENVILGNGSDEIIDFVVRAFKGPFSGSYPSFANYSIISKTHGQRYMDVSLDDGFAFNPDNLLVEASDARVLFLCSPNNPTGQSIKDSDLEKLLDTKRLVVLDEAYAEFAKKSRVDWVSDYPNLIVLRTFSKAFGLAGLRVGYAVASGEAIGFLEKVKPPFNTNTLAQAAAYAALEDTEYMMGCVQKTIEQRGILKEALEKRFKVFDSDANFLLVDTGDFGSDKLYKSLLDNRIIIRRFGRFEGFEGDYVRITVGKEDENQMLIKALEKT